MLARRHADPGDSEAYWWEVVWAFWGKGQPDEPDDTWHCRLIPVNEATGEIGWIPTQKSKIEWMSGGPGGESPSGTHIIDLEPQIRDATMMCLIPSTEAKSVRPKDGRETLPDWAFRTRCLFCKPYFCIFVFEVFEL